MIESIRLPETIMTWNVALLERSAEAPVGWSVEHSEALVRERVLAQAPDIVCFQELPAMVPYIETHDMVKGNPRSHSGHLAMLYHRDLPVPSVRVIEGVGVLATFDDQITIANVHLAPGPGGAAVGERLKQLATVVEASPTDVLVIAGDTNTRVAEIEALENADLGAPLPPSPTWDSRWNRFSDEGPKFAAFFTRAFTFGPVEIIDQIVLKEPVEHDGKTFHLSDHFALLLEIGPAEL